MKKYLFLFTALTALAVSAAPYQRKLPKTYIFSRGQWHYNPVLNYGGRWADIPLLNDPELNAGMWGTSSLAAYKAMAKNVQEYGLDGLASLKGNDTPLLIKMLEKNNVPGFILLPEIYGTGQGMYKGHLPLKQMRAVADKIFLASAQSRITLKHNGKTIISSYNADDRPPEFWQALLEDYRRTEGDKFIFLPLLERPQNRTWHNWRAEWAAGKLTAARKNLIKEHFRKYARACDGIYLGCAPVKGSHDRHTDMEFFQVMIDLASEVLAEPEFKDKLFAIAARIGHENATRVGYIRGSYGTWCYRETMKRAIAANPDIIVIPEWDEQNENTSLRPTRFNMSSFTRITRVFQGLSPDLPHDDKSIPNLIVSYRKHIALGENTEFEVLGLPDAGGPVKAVFTLRSPQGKVIYKSPEYAFSGKEMKEYRFNLPSEKFAAYPYLLPEITVTRNGRSRLFADGMQYIKIEPASNHDYQFAKQPLRDIIIPKAADIKWQDGKVSVKFDAGEKLAFAEILDDNIPVEAATADGKPFWRENEKENIFTISFQNIGNSRDQLRGTLRVPGIANVRWMRDTTAGWPTRMGVPFTGNTCEIDFNQRVEMTRYMLAIPASKVDQAVLEIKIPGYFETNLPLAKVLKEKSFGVPGKKMPVMCVARQNFQLLQVVKLRKNAVNFTTEVNPQSKRSTLHFQALTESGKVYRSKPVSVEKVSTAKGKIKVYSETANKPVELTVPANRIPRYDYVYSAKAGTAIHCDAGLRYSGVAGGYPALISSRHGARRDSTVFISARDFPKKGVMSSPVLGKSAWEFSHQGQHIALPTGVISRRTAFTLTMTLCQKDNSGTQTLLDNVSSQPGVITVLAEKGEVKVIITDHKVRANRCNTGLFLPLNKSVTLKLHYGLDKLTVSLGDKTFSAPVYSPGLCDCVTSVGGGRFGYFKGDISRITVDYKVK